MVIADRVKLKSRWRALINFPNINLIRTDFFFLKPLKRLKKLLVQYYELLTNIFANNLK